MESPVGPQTQLLQPGDLLNPDLRRKVETKFGFDEAWLLLSIFYYGWRTFYDLAQSMLTGVGPCPQSIPAPLPFDDEFQITRHLQLQSFVYSAVEQFASLVGAARAELALPGAFLETYVSPRPIPDLIRSLPTLSRVELEALVGDSAQIRASVDRWRLKQEAAAGHADVGLLDPARMRVTNVGGVLVPSSAIEAGARNDMQRSAEGLLDLFLTNINQMQELVDPPPNDQTPRKSQSLREVDNSFRHGLRVLFHSVVPSQKGFTLIGESPSERGLAVTVFLPKGGSDSVSYGGVDCDPKSTSDLLEVLRQISTRTGQFARAFIGFQCFGNADLLVSSSLLALDGTDGYAPPGISGPEPLLG